MFYEMVTEKRAFAGEDVKSLCQSILESTPLAPLHANPKVHPLLSDLIMKALAKDPALRYQTGKELLDDLENCKESRPAVSKKPDAPKGPAAAIKTNAEAQSKFVGPGEACHSESSRGSRRSWRRNWIFPGSSRNRSVELRPQAGDCFRTHVFGGGR